MNTVSSLLVSVLFFFMGFIGARAKFRASALAIEFINLSLFYVAIPVIIFNSIYSARDLGTLSLAIVASILHIAIVFAIAFSFTLTRKAVGCCMSRAIAYSLSLAMPNAGYLAIPLSVILYNESESVIPYTIAFNIVLPVVIFVLSFYGSALSSRLEKLRLALMRSLPFLVAFSLAFLLRYFSVSLPMSLHIVFNGVKWYTLTSFALVGYEFTKTIRNSFAEKFVYELLASVIIRYVISPLLIMAMIMTLNLHEYSRGLILQSIMPPAVANIILAKIFRLDTDIVSILIVALTPMSIALSFIIRFLSMV